VEEAVKKFGVAPERIHAWVTQGLICTEDKVMRLNGDDLALKLEELTGT
jgi:DNA-binding transcriptional MerR regulator